MSLYVVFCVGYFNVKGRFGFWSLKLMAPRSLMKLLCDVDTCVTLIVSFIRRLWDYSMAIVTTSLCHLHYPLLFVSRVIHYCGYNKVKFARWIFLKISKSVHGKFVFMIPFWDNTIFLYFSFNYEGTFSFWNQPVEHCLLWSS